MKPEVISEQVERVRTAADTLKAETAWLEVLLEQARTFLRETSSSQPRGRQGREDGA